VVHGVEHVKAQLKCRPLRDREVLAEAHINRPGTRPADAVLADVPRPDGYSPGCAGGYSLEGGLIEVKGVDRGWEHVSVTASLVIHPESLNDRQNPHSRRSLKIVNNNNQISGPEYSSCRPRCVHGV
jgi:hypothetical protein